MDAIYERVGGFHGNLFVCLQHQPQQNVPVSAMGASVHMEPVWTQTICQLTSSVTNGFVTLQRASTSTYHSLTRD